MKQWLIKSPMSQDMINKFPEINPVILQLLADRGLKTQKEIDEFLYPDYSQDIHDPFLFSQMPQALERIYKAKENEEKVVIYGDYDADGVCGSAILAKTFNTIGLPFEVYLPDRQSEGYGLNQAAINEFASRGIKLIITVDCGISNTAEVNQANEMGIDIIITDHHHFPPSPPQAYAIIHPTLDKKYPFKQLAGGGVAFKLAQAIIQDPRSQHAGKINESNRELISKWMLDLVAISTVADMVPLLGENRTLVKYGMLVLAKTKNLGLEKLMEFTGIKMDKIDGYTIGWQIAPKINAAGRMMHANSAYQLLTTENVEEAITIAHDLNKRNQERQALTEKLIEESKKQLTGDMGKQPVLFVKGDDWPAGVIGLVASKLTNIFARPAIVLTQNHDLLVASGRSIEEFNLIESLDKFKEYFEKYGGHSGAAGFSLRQEKFEEFKEKFINFAKEKLKDVEFLSKLTIDLELKLKDIGWLLIEALQSFEPYGQENFRPKFLIKNLEIKTADTVGQDKKHLRLVVSEGDLYRKVICFGFGGQSEKLESGKFIDIVCEIGVNEWNGNKEIQLSLVDFKYT